jgi:hypothetical protein
MHTAADIRQAVDDNAAGRIGAIAPHHLEDK